MDVSDDVDEDPTGNRALWDRGVLSGASQKVSHYVDGLVQDCSNSSTLAMELLQSSTKPSIWYWLVNDNTGRSLSGLVLNENETGKLLTQFKLIASCWKSEASQVM